MTSGVRIFRFKGAQREMHSKVIVETVRASREKTLYILAEFTGKIQTTSEANHKSSTNGSPGMDIRGIGGGRKSL